MLHRTRTPALVLVAALASGACSESVTSTAPSARPAAPDQVGMSAVKFWEVGSTVRWHRKAIDLFRARGGPFGRRLSYLSLAQYRAVLAARDGTDGRIHPSLAAAAAGASVVVLKQYYPLDAQAIEAMLDAQRAETPWPGEKNKDFAAGEAIGRAVAAAVLAFAASDNDGVLDPGLPPVGAGYWLKAPSAIVRGGYGARPFFLSSNTELISPPPPAFGSAEFLAALAEVRTTTDNRTSAQLAIAQKWIPFAGVLFDLVAGDLIAKYHVKELEAARIYAYGNTAANDAIVACFHTKFTYWYLRPSQADPLITTPVGLPNHPSYPSAHSCQTGAWQTILTDAFPAERDMLAAMAQEAADSRMFAGLHYRFDNEAAIALGRAGRATGAREEGA